MPTASQELQIATVDTALATFVREVGEPGLRAPEGVARVAALCDAFLSYVERGVFPGGCFFISAATELEGREGRVADHVREVYPGILEGFAGAVERARELGELDAGADADQLLFELDSLMIGANLGFVFFRDPAAPDRARRAIRQRLDRTAPAG